MKYCVTDGAGTYIVKGSKMQVLKQSVNRQEALTTLNTAIHWLRRADEWFGHTSWFVENEDGVKQLALGEAK